MDITPSDKRGNRQDCNSTGYPEHHALAKQSDGRLHRQVFGVSCGDIIRKRGSGLSPYPTGDEASMWYIVILTSVDYYTMYEGVKVVKASSAKEAADIALQDEYKHVSVEKMYQCGRTKPKEV